MMHNSGCSTDLSEMHLYLLARSTPPEPRWASQKREDSRVGEGVRQRSPLATAYLWVECLCVHKTRLSICERLSRQQKTGYFRLPSWIFDEDGLSIICSSWEQRHSHFRSRISRTNKNRPIAESFGKQPGIFWHTWSCADFLPPAKIKIYCQISFTVVNVGSKERRL